MRPQIPYPPMSRPYMPNYPTAQEQYSPNHTSMRPYSEQSPIANGEGYTYGSENVLKRNHDGSVRRSPHSPPNVTVAPNNMTPQMYPGSALLQSLDNPGQPEEQLPSEYDNPGKRQRISEDKSESSTGISNDEGYSNEAEEEYRQPHNGTSEEPHEYSQGQPRYSPSIGHYPEAPTAYSVPSHLAPSQNAHYSSYYQQQGQYYQQNNTDLMQPHAY
ncbi:hypothetical protein LOTGIDRAFT_167567 [Lottia gigantea]|uniref:Uncharacterized protein n=1 Tax=Lottia gigantea TaxID=225164 RepID=V3Z5M1_LOTGI|nr:hypothetical protein LOTGIDRAFT_167567 [Lottia gigantea]ESO86063.1 hypothetical protein LOTGIDRAFT_167567 [Lottia gigantea]